MEWFTADWLAALFSIIMIDLVLAGDNAIVIGLAARNLPGELQKRAILWGTAGAILIRTLATLGVVWLLRIPGLLFIGGLLLVWIAYKLLADKKDHDIPAKNRLGAAIWTIVMADAVMGFDNVIAVAGAAHGEFALVVIGLLVSVPIVVWGSKLFIHLTERYPIIIYVGAGVLGFTAGKMLTGDLLVKSFFEANPIAKWGLVAAITAGVLIAGRWKQMLDSLARINDQGELTIPKQLGDAAGIRPDDRFTVRTDARGQLVLVKQADDDYAQNAG
ncbi:TerC family protein [Paenibacillus hamazuiensis]|uniref:YjbE family putative metal transport protein n=1 Tax=Paenibacillus hamazuiensis TaxID=2936508 RepID=UPI00200D38CB|nr:TerC family protein [Paenibacillus hamazuiensis]